MSGLDKDAFISLIKGHAQDFTMNTATFTDKVSKRGDVSRQKKEDELKAHEQESELLKLIEELERNKLNALVDISNNISITDNILTYNKIKNLGTDVFSNKHRPENDISTKNISSLTKMKWRRCSIY